jgi:hypothetical protein
MKWFFLVSFVAALIICCLLTSALIFGIATRGIKWIWIGGIIILPQIVLFIWGAREMFRSFKGVGLND